MLPMSGSEMYGTSNNARAAVSKDFASTTSFHEPSIPKLLLNYFVCMPYEEASVRMARELGYVKTNKDAIEFNNLYKIGERAYIVELIKKGNISEAMEEINSTFGIEVLERNSDLGSRSGTTGNYESSTRSLSNSNNGKEDLHFKLLLLNLIEMIRAHDKEKRTNESAEDSDEFVLKLIQYSQEKLALKASSNRSYMAEVELVMTLLLFPMDNKFKIKKPKSLKNLYSLSLRTKIADLVNRKILSHIHSEVEARCAKDNKFPNLIGSDKGIINKQSSAISEVLMVRPKEDIGLNLKTEKVADIRDSPDGVLKSSPSVSEDWANTVDMIKTGQKSSKSVSGLSDSDPSVDDFDLSEYQYEPRLVQVMKLWAWCENQLHNNDIGVPRVGSNT